jgi:lysine-specific demethylase/histidyl-hydroxylase NO66
MTGITQGIDSRIPEGTLPGISAKWLSRCVGDAEHFLARSFAKAPYLSRGDSGRFEGIFSRAELSRLLAMGIVPVTKVRLSNHDRAISARAWAKEENNIIVVDGERIERLIREGSTLVVSGVDRFAHGLFELCGGLQAELSYRLGANIFLSPPFAQGFSTHVDEHDVIVLQLEGEKDWQVYGSGGPIIQARLRKGDSLYVPRGFAHCAASADQSSLHASIGIRPATVADLLSYVVNEFAGSPELARTLQPGFAHRPDDLGPLLGASGQALGQQVEATGMDELAHAFCHTWINVRQRAARRIRGTTY